MKIKEKYVFNSLWKLLSNELKNIKYELFFLVLMITILYVCNVHKKTTQSSECLSEPEEKKINL